MNKIKLVIFTLIAVLLLSLALCSCGDQKKEDPQPTAEPTAEVVDTAEPVEEPTAEPAEDIAESAEPAEEPTEQPAA